MLDPGTHPCSVHAYHSPKVWRTEGHHQPPLSWTRALGLPDGRIVPLCGTGHDTLHIALTQRIRGLPYSHRLDPDMAPLIDEAADFFAAHPGQLRGLPFTEELA